MESVFDQSINNYEYIVIDGASTDGSKELIQENAGKIDRWVCEADNGIFHAQNKGFAMSSGDYVIFLNSGDIFHNNNVLNYVHPYLEEGFDIVYGDLMICDADKTLWLKKYDNKLTLKHFFVDTLPHQGSFIKRSLLEAQGGKFDESLALSADWKFFLISVGKLMANCKYVPIPISIYDYTGASSQKENSKIILKERNKVLKEEFPFSYEDTMAYIYIEEENRKLSAAVRNLSASRMIRFYFKIKRLLTIRK